jgi:hypothetical protein
MSVYGTDFQLLHCTKSRRDPGTLDMTDGLSGLNSGAHDPQRSCGLKKRCSAAKSLTRGMSGISVSPADFGKLIAEETEKWGKVVKSAGIQGGLIRAAKLGESRLDLGVGEGRIYLGAPTKTRLD